MNRGHTINPLRKKLWEASNTIAAQRHYKYQLMQMRAEARKKVEMMDKLIVRITAILERDPNV